MNTPSKCVAAIAVALALPLAALAQTTPSADKTTKLVRSPVSGDLGSSPSKMHHRAAAVARADKQPPGTENGNAPDRAAAGGGSR